MVVRSETGGENSLGLVLVDVIFESHCFVIAFDRGVILVELVTDYFVLGPLNVKSLQGRVCDSECVLVADFLLEVHFEYGAGRCE